MTSLLATNSDQRFFVICNINKKGNIIGLLNTARSFHFQIILVGMKKLLESLQILHGLNSGEYLYMKTIHEVKDFFQTMSIPLIGIEIDPSAVSIISEHRLFSSSIAFMPGNEGLGMSEQQKSICDGFVYIPQTGAGIESLNVTVASSIILYEYSTWLQGN